MIPDIRWRTAACLTIALGAVHPVLAQHESVRHFELPTIERLGVEIHAQDQLAWHATDALFREKTRDELAREGLAGWITSSDGTGDFVRFVRLIDDEPEVLYDVKSSGDRLVLTVPANRELTRSELAQYRARRLAIENIGEPCLESYNTVALPDPGSDDWLVWALVPQVTDDALPMGGHVRFTISSNGRRLRSKDNLSKSCFAVPTGPDDGRVPSSVFASHNVSLTPVETHVFLSLMSDLPLHIGTLDGQMWRVEAGRIFRIDMDSPDADGYAARNFAGLNETCGASLETAEDPPRYVNTEPGSIRVIQATEGSEEFTLDIDSELRPVMVVCSRLDIVPAPNDYKVVDVGLVLYIQDVGEGHASRMGVLDRFDGEYVFAIVAGEQPDSELQRRIDERLESFPE